jgi:hypothetical protein
LTKKDRDKSARTGAVGETFEREPNVEHESLVQGGPLISCLHPKVAMGSP